MSPSVPCSQFFPRVSLYYQGASVETLIMNTSVVWCFLGIHVLSTKTNKRMRIGIFYELLFVLGKKTHTHITKEVFLTYRGHSQLERKNSLSYLQEHRILHEILQFQPLYQATVLCIIQCEMGIHPV